MNESFFKNKITVEMGNLWQLYKCALEGVSAIPDITPENAAKDAMEIAKAAEQEWENEVKLRKIEAGR